MTDAHRTAAAGDGPMLSPLEQRIADAILSAYRVPPEVLPAMAERVALAVGDPGTGDGPALGEDARLVRLVAEARIHARVARRAGRSGDATLFDVLASAVDATAALVAEARAAGKAEERERIAREIEADPGSHWVPIKDYCMADTGCGEDPCPGHPDGYSIIHGRKHYARIARGES